MDPVISTGLVAKKTFSLSKGAVAVLETSMIESVMFYMTHKSDTDLLQQYHQRARI